MVVATNSPVNDRFTLHTRQFPYMTYVVGLKVPRGLPDVLIWDTLDPYHYARLAGKPGPDGSDTLIVGGEDHKTGQEHDGEERFRKLAEWAHDHFPTAGEVTHQWAGQVLETLDGLANIGRNPGDENVYVVTGDSGMGMTHGTIAALLIPELIAGNGHPWKDVFDPAGAGAGGREFVAENVNVAWQYADYLTGSGSSRSTTSSRVGRGRADVAVEGRYREREAIPRVLGGLLHLDRTGTPPEDVDARNGSRFNATASAASRESTHARGCDGGQ